jgi:hypothetical protein
MVRSTALLIRIRSNIIDLCPIKPEQKGEKGWKPAEMVNPWHGVGFVGTLGTALKMNYDDEALA